jgi:hypothetical protein
MCEECKLRRRGQLKGVVVRPILSSSFNSRGHVDLVDMQSMPDGIYRSIMNYQDLLTKFCVVENLTSKRAAEVAYKLLTSVFLVLLYLNVHPKFLFQMKYFKIYRHIWMTNLLIMHPIIQIVMLTLMCKIKPNLERTYRKWQQFIKTVRKDDIQK